MKNMHLLLIFGTMLGLASFVCFVAAYNLSEQPNLSEQSTTAPKEEPVNWEVQRLKNEVDHLNKMLKIKQDRIDSQEKHIKKQEDLIQYVNETQSKILLHYGN